MYLQSTDEKARLLVPPLTQDTSLVNVFVCVEYNENNHNGRLVVERRSASAADWIGVGYPPKNE